MYALIAQTSSGTLACTNISTRMPNSWEKKLIFHPFFFSVHLEGKTITALLQIT